MDTKDIIAQGFGIIGLVLFAWSFQEKDNTKLFIKQGLSGFMFFLNYALIGAAAAALFNITNLVRALVYAKNTNKKWSLILIEALYGGCFVFSLFAIWGDWFQIFLAVITYISLVATSISMWTGNGKYIRYVQLAIASPAWLIHNIFNFTLGGIICEIFAMTSVVISFIRYGKDGFEAGKSEVTK